MSPADTGRGVSERPAGPADVGVWGSNTDAHSVAAFLRAARSVVVLTHAKPDGDSIGSTAALARTLLRLSIPVKLCYVGPMSRWADELLAGLDVLVLEPGRELSTASVESTKDWLGNPEAIAVCDTGSWSQLAEVKPWLVGRFAHTVVIDHHVHGDAQVAQRRLIRTDAASATQVLAPVCKQLLGLAAATPLPAEIAESLYLGLATDTGWFRFSSVTPETYRLAGELLESGFDHTRLYKLIEQQDLPGRWRLLGRALESLKLIPISAAKGGGDLALMRLTRRDFALTGGDSNETGGFADMTLSITSVHAAALLVEQEPLSEAGPTIIKVSVRSKPGDSAVDVNAAMRELGGGGHVRAAGAKVRASLDEAEALVVRAIV